MSNFFTPAHPTFQSSFAKWSTANPHGFHVPDLEYTADSVDNAFSFVVKNNEYFIPFSENIDVEGEIKKIEEELKYTQGFLNSVNKKLENKRFVDNAPAKVVEMENAKKEDAVSKIRILEEKLKSLS